MNASALHPPTPRWVLALVAGACMTAWPVDYQFNVPSGDWQTGTNWSPNGFPSSPDSANVNAGRSVTIDALTGNIGTSGDRLDNIGAGGNQQGAVAGNGTISQSGSTVMTDWARFGRGAANTGTFNLSGGTFDANRLYVGGENDNATGFLNMSGGTLAVNTDFRVGHSQQGGTSRGTFTLSNGTINSSGISMVMGHRAGGSGTALGTFGMTGGTANLGSLQAGLGAQGYGTLNMGGGTINTGSLYVGGASSAGTGQLNMTSGRINISGTGNEQFEVGGQDANAQGTLVMSGGSIQGSGWMNVGREGARGVVDMSGGTISVTQFRVGNGAGSSGTVNNHGGSLINTYTENGWATTARIINSAGTFSTTGGQLTVGPAGGDATVDVTGGTLAAGEIRLGSNHGQTASSRGTLNLSGTGLVSAGTLNAGYRNGGAGPLSDGTFNISGGNANLTGLVLGVDAVSRGYMVSSGGTVNVSGNMNIGGAGAGTLTHSGGTLNVNGDWIEVVQANGGTGVLNLSGGTINHNGAQRTILGTRGNATATISGSGRLNTGYLHVGGSYEGQTITVGMNQSGGTVTTSTLQIGGGNATTAYNLEGGALRFSTLNAFGNGSTQLNWGSGALSQRQFDAGNATGADLSSGTGFTQVRNSTTTFITNANLTTGSGTGQASKLDLGGIYLSAGNVLFDHLVVGAGRTLALSSTSDVLEFDDDTVYLMRPFGFNTEDYGSLPLVTTTGGGSITGTFDTFLGLSNDGRGFSMSSFAVTTATASTLAANTWYLEQTGSAITFHYKVAGVVPEPDTFALLALSAIGLRTARTLRERRRRVMDAAPSV